MTSTSANSESRDLAFAAADVLLTIAIPTFNRNALLALCLAEINAQVSVLAVTGSVRIVVIDNASPTPVVDTLGPLPPWVEVRRNPVNVGGNGNILRCFETCMTPWLWVIGDDDRPEAGAVAAALASVNEHADAVAILHAVRNQVIRERGWSAVGADDFMRRLDNFGNLLFVSSTLYRLAPLRPFFDLGYHYAYSCAPHLVLLFSALSRDGGRIAFLPTSNIAYERPEVENRGWIIPIARGLPILLELPHLSRATRWCLGRHLSRFPTLGSLVHQSLLRQRFAHGGVLAETANYLVGLTRLPWRYAPLRRVLGLALVPILLVPWLSYPVVALAFRVLTGQASGRHKLPVDRY